MGGAVRRLRPDGPVARCLSRLIAAVDPGRDFEPGFAEALRSMVSFWVYGPLVALECFAVDGDRPNAAVVLRIWWDAHCATFVELLSGIAIGSLLGIALGTGWGTAHVGTTGAAAVTSFVAMAMALRGRTVRKMFDEDTYPYRVEAPKEDDPDA